MNYSLLILPLAKADIKEINFHYHKIDKTLALKFNSFLKKEVSINHENSLIYQVKYDEIRIAKIDNFPYNIHYEIHSETIIINAISHTSRDFKSLLNRP